MIYYKYYLRIMSRINGFKNLDELLPKSVDELIKQGIIKDDSYSFDKLLYNIKLNDSNYYFKECPYQEAIIELIVNEILDKLKIKNVKYDLAKWSLWCYFKRL